MWGTNADTRVRFESHPEGLKSGDSGFNPRHHGEHFHVEIKPNGVSWNNACKNGLIIKPELPGIRLVLAKVSLMVKSFPDTNESLMLDFTKINFSDAAITSARVIRVVC